jgi:hypothetical protein
MALYTQNLSEIDGIVGMGPKDLTENTVISLSTVPTFMENLVSEGVIVSYPPFSLALSAFH